MLDEIACRNDLRVLTSIALHHEETSIKVLEQIAAMIAQNARASIVCRPSTLGRVVNYWKATRKTSRSRGI